MFKRLRHWLYCRRNDLPTRYKVAKALCKEPPIGRTVRYIALAYVEGIDIQFLAKQHDCTRERIRQCLWRVIFASEHLI